MSRPALDQPVARPVARPAPVATTAVLVDEPRFATLWATLVYTLVVLVLAYPALTGHFLVNPNSDEYIAGYAFREYGATTLRETGGFALWNPYLFGGLPCAAWLSRHG